MLFINLRTVFRVRKHPNYLFLWVKSISEVQYTFDVTCQGSVPQAITAILESNNFEDAVRKAVSLGGDSDTQACIAGGIAHAFYGKLPDIYSAEVHSRLEVPLRQIVTLFCDLFSCR